MLDKGLVFDYLNQIRKDYVKILNSYRFTELIPFRELIVAEIFADATSLLIAIDSSHFDNVDTAKRLAHKATLDFFKKDSLNTTITKYWRNNGVCGLVKINISLDNVSLFQKATDIKSDKVKTLVDILLRAANEFEPKTDVNEPEKPRKLFEWVMAVILVVVMTATAIIIFNLNTNPHKSTPKKQDVKEYIYLQNYPAVIHADRKCKRLNYKNVESERIPVSNIRSIGEHTFCPYCVTDEVYERLNNDVYR